MTKSTNQKLKLPDFFNSVLWSYDFSLVDPQKEKKRIIINSINYGEWRHLKWIINNYGKDQVKKIIKNTPKTEFLKAPLTLISLLLNIKSLKYASRSDYIEKNKSDSFKKMSKELGID